MKEEICSNDSMGNSPKNLLPGIVPSTFHYRPIYGKDDHGPAASFQLNDIAFVQFHACSVGSPDDQSEVSMFLGLEKMRGSCGFKDDCVSVTVRPAILLRTFHGRASVQRQNPSSRGWTPLTSP